MMIYISNSYRIFVIQTISYKYLAKRLHRLEKKGSRILKCYPLKHHNHQRDHSKDTMHLQNITIIREIIPRTPCTCKTSQSLERSFQEHHAPAKHHNHYRDHSKDTMHLQNEIKEKRNRKKDDENERGWYCYTNWVLNIQSLSGQLHYTQIR